MLASNLCWSSCLGLLFQCCDCKYKIQHPILFLFFFETGFPVSRAGLEFSVHLRIILNFWSSCLNLLSSGITDIHCHTCIMQVVAQAGIHSSGKTKQTCSRHNWMWHAVLIFISVATCMSFGKGSLDHLYFLKAGLFFLLSICNIYLDLGCLWGM